MRGPGRRAAALRNRQRRIEGRLGPSMKTEAAERGEQAETLHGGNPRRRS